MKSSGLLVLLAALSFSEGTLLPLLTDGLVLKKHAIVATKLNTVKAFKPSVPVKFGLYKKVYPYPPPVEPPTHYEKPTTTSTLPPPPPPTTTTTTTTPPPPTETTTTPTTTPCSCPPPATTEAPPPPPPPPTTTTTEEPTTVPPYVPHESYGVPTQPSVQPTYPHESYGVPTLPPAPEAPTNQPPHNPEDCPLTKLQENLYQQETTFGENAASQLVFYPAVPETSVGEVHSWKTYLPPASPPYTEVDNSKPETLGSLDKVREAEPVPFATGLTVPALTSSHFPVQFDMASDIW